jgi:hypothetical protein
VDRKVEGMAPAVQASTKLQKRTNDLSRAETLARYRHYSDLRKKIQTNTLENVPGSTLTQCAKRIGLSDGKVIFTDNVAELTLVFDLAVYTSRAGRSRAIDRYSRRLNGSDPDEARVLQSLQGSRFSIFRVIGRAAPAGVLFDDLMRGGVTSLLDEGLEQSAQPGDLFAMRVASIEDFSITCGAVVPIDTETGDTMTGRLTNEATVTELTALADDWRFAASIYKLAIEFGMMSSVIYR